VKGRTGVALVSAFLVAAALFTLLLATASDLALVHRRRALDHGDELAAHYAAESGLALARTRLREVAGELERALAGGGLRAAGGAHPWQALRPVVAEFCGGEASLPLTPPPPDRILCEAGGAENASAAALAEFLRERLRPPGPGERPNLPDRAFAPGRESRALTAETGYEVAYGYAPARVRTLADGALSFELEAAPVHARGYVRRDGHTSAQRRLRLDLPWRLTITIGAPRYEHYVLFTQDQATARGHRVYFDDRTLMDGDVHTNGHFNFTGEPWFSGTLTSAGCPADSAKSADCARATPGYYYAQGTGDVFTPPVWPPPPHANTHPSLPGEPLWDAPFLPLGNAGALRAAAAGGLWLEDHDEPRTPGQRDVQRLVLGVAREGGKTYQYLLVYGRELQVATDGQGAFAPWRAAYRIDEAGRVELDEGGGWKPLARAFNGVIYVGDPRSPSSFTLSGAGVLESPREAEAPNPRIPAAGGCDPALATAEDGRYCIEPSVARFARLTIAGHTVLLDRDLTYEDRPCSEAPARGPGGAVRRARCERTDAVNLLGVVALDGDLVIAADAPPDLHLDAVLMAPAGSLRAAGEEERDRGSLYVVGSVIEANYGELGTARRGYGPRFVHDPRLRLGQPGPPHLPAPEAWPVWALEVGFEEGQEGVTAAWRYE